MRRTNQVAFSLILAAALSSAATLPVWGMGVAVFLDTDRAVLSSQPSPNGRRIAQVEKLIVGGVPSIMVTVRPSWMPDWYLPTCVAASHYLEANASIAWVSSETLTVTSSASSRFWNLGKAPFHSRPCSNLSVAIVNR